MDFEQVGAAVGAVTGIVGSISGLYALYFTRKTVVPQPVLHSIEAVADFGLFGDHLCCNWECTIGARNATGFSVVAASLAPRYLDRRILRRLLVKAYLPAAGLAPTPRGLLPLESEFPIVVATGSVAARLHLRLDAQLAVTPPPYSRQSQSIAVNRATVPDVRLESAHSIGSFSH